MILAELHYHTAESSPCGRVPARQGISLYKKAGYDAVVVTDHFSRIVCGKEGKSDWEMVVERFLKGYREAEKAGEELGLKVFFGMELRFPHDENDFLIYGLEEGFLKKAPWLYEKELSQVCGELRQAGAVIVQAHPFRSVCTPAAPDCLDGVEIFNGNPRQNSHNELAEAWAQKQGLFGVAGSDFHQPEDAARAGVYLETLPRDERELARWLKAGEYQLHF